MLKLIDRYPAIIYIGGALLGYVAGEMLLGEALFAPLLESHHYLHWLAPGLGALLVVALGRWLAMRKTVPAAAVDLVDEKVAAGPKKVLAGMGGQSAGSGNKS